MKIPHRIQPLIDDGMIDAVLQRLKSGKEADVYTVLCGEEIRCAKVYKETTQRSFKQAVHYREGRNVRNSRSARAMQKTLSSAANSRKKPGRRRKLMHFSDWIMPESGYLSLICALMVCC